MMDTTQTVDYAIDKLKPVFDKLEELGVAGWEIAVRQQVITGVTNAVITFMFGIFNIIGFTHIGQSVGQILNPGWYAIQALLELL